MVRQAAETSVSMNLAHQYAESNYGSVSGAMDANDGCCIDFAGELVDTTPGSRLAYFDTPRHPRWKYHAAMELSGMIHDLWSEHPMPLDEFMKSIGADAVEYPAHEPA